MSLTEVFVKTNMMKFMEESQRIENFHLSTDIFLYLREERKQLLLSIKSRKNLKNNIISYVDSEDDLYYFFRGIVDYPPGRFSDIYYLRAFMNKNLGDELQNVFEKKHKTFMLKSYDHVRHEVDPMLQIRGNNRVYSDEFDSFFYFTEIIKDKSVGCSDKFYWTYRIESMSSKKSLLTPQLKALIY